MKRTAGLLAALIGTSVLLVGTRDRAQAPTYDPNILNGLSWRFVGPVRGGRSVAVAGDAANPLVFYFGSAHGGVWKTLDGGTYWRNVSDGYLKTAPIGAIDVSLSNPAVVYVGMGEALTRQDITPGDGVYKSVDGGATWTHVGLATTRHIAKIRIHPTNPDIVFVAAAGDMFGTNPDRGIFRTTDGGTTWKRVLYKSDRASAVDLVIDPTNPNILFASLDQLERLPWTEMSGGPDSGLYKSTDGGDSWTEITKNPGLPKGVVGKIGIALSPPRPARLWTLIEAEDGGVFRSDDSGATWQRVNDRHDLRRAPASYMHIVADTRDADTVYVPSYDLHKSTDGGKTFTTIPMAHGDHHALWIDPRNSSRMIEGNDGGATVTLDGAASWSTQLNQPTADLFSLAIDDRYPYWMYGAQNDNTHVSTPSQTKEGAIPWSANEPLPGGEGGQTAVRPDGSVVYAADRAGIERFDRRTGQSTNISVWPDDEFTFATKDVKYRFYYTFPVVLSPHDPSVLYTAANQVFRTTNEGVSWDAISPDLTRNRQDKMQKIPGGPITSMWSSLYWVSLIQAIAESPLKKGELWVGTDDSTIQLTRNGGTSWENVSPRDLGEWTTITNIEVSPHDPGTAYVAANRYRVSDRAPYFYRTTDYGHTWRKITDGIRENDFAWVIREDPARRGLLYAGTETGAYVSFDAGSSWQPLQHNLPAVQVRNMLVKGHDLVIATHGRGFWILDNLSPLRQLTADVTTAAAHLFDIEPAYRYLPEQTLSPHRPIRPGLQFARTSDTVVYEDRRDADGLARRVFLNAGENPPGGVTIDYALKQTAAETVLTILDASGAVVKRFSSKAQDAAWLPARAGLNRFAWDMRYPAARQRPIPQGFVSAEYPRAQAPVAPPGRYVARLTSGGQQYERPFEIRRDPRLTATDDDLQAEFDLMVRISKRLSEVTDALDRLGKAREQLASKPADAAAVKDKLQAIESALTRIPGPNPNMLPPKALNDRLAALSGEVQHADARPTRPMYAVFDDLSAAVAKQLQLLDQIAPAHATPSK